MSEIKPKTKSIKGCRTFDEILDVEYGTQGTPERDAFEQGAVAFIRTFEGGKIKSRINPGATRRKNWHEKDLYFPH